MGIFNALVGILTLAMMVLPTIIRTTEESLIAVPDLFREGSFGLGAGKLRTIFVIVLPSAVPGILSGVILAIGRIVGESAALIFTAGSVAAVPDSFFIFNKNFGSSYVLLIVRRTLHKSGLCNSSNITFDNFLINGLSQMVYRENLQIRNWNR